MDRWHDCIALVTGSSAGIGKSIAIELARQGMIVIGWARRLENLKIIENQLSSEGKIFVGRKCDVTQETSVSNEIAWIEKTYGKLHVVVNNAGIGRVASLTEGKTQLWQEVIDVNVIAAAVISRETLKLMRKCGINDGHIFFLNSIVGHYITPLIGAGMYCASKHGITCMADMTRKELIASGFKTRVTSISPSYTKSEIFEKSGRKVSADEPMLESQDIANIVVWILSTAPSVQITEVIVRPTGSQF
ncbi:farnesol dehydrogenase-like [Daktulosphaira vitifoliae]|uniref:farnesol dehydrogenase-like n=1 Tax=Daktulosphaira vitifoliae TaxID=58002 RepID=UPI0021AAB615|nr:farnesol dehydrogenase-like [Daktulosphaira vitifoliae]